ncbi:MAG: hypothetical protein IPH98_14775 [Saprospiraceae bacterium]|nr:hypothetical protein [Candidatus Defluviibacterium haderslevense]
MDILRSNNKWHCSLLIFSGRPDPQWIPKASMVDKLLTIADCAPISNMNVELPSILGYRGVVLVSETLSITAFKGYLYLTTGHEFETRIDHNQEFEKMILNDVPKKYKHLPLNE